MKKADIEKAWIDFLNIRATGFTVTKAEFKSGNPSPRPSTKYLTLKITAGPIKVGLEDDRRFNSTSGKFDLVGERRYTASIQAFKADVIDILETISSGLDDINAKLYFDEKGIVIENRGSVLDISSLIEAGFEDRASLDVIFRAVNAQSSEITPLEKVDISGNIKDELENEREVDLTIEKP